jgi:hypothetical protein
MRARDTSSPSGAWRGSAVWLGRRDGAGGPALLYLTGGLAAFVVLAITLLAVVEQAWMLGVALIVLALSIAALTGFIAVMIAGNEADEAPAPQR